MSQYVWLIQVNSKKTKTKPNGIKKWAEHLSSHFPMKRCSASLPFPPPGDRTWVSNVSYIGKRVFYHQHHLGSPVITRQMQIKMTMQYHLPPAKMAVIKKTGDNKCWQRYGEEATLMHCWWECKWVQPLLKGRWGHLNHLKIELTKKIYHMIQQCRFWAEIQSKITISKRYLYFHVHNSIIYNSQDKLSVRQQTNKENVAYVYNGVSLSHKKEEMPPFVTM